MARLYSDEEVKDLFGAYVPPEPVAQSSAVKGRNTGIGGDIWTGLKSGAEQIPGIATGLADIPTALAFGARPFTRGAEALGRATGFEPGKWAEEAQRQYSPQMQQSTQEVEQAWQDPNASLLEKTGAVLAHPRYMTKQVAENLPSMIAGGVGGRALMTAGRAALPAAEGAIARTAPGYLERAVGKKWASPVAAGVGEGATQAGQAMEQGKESADQRKIAAASLASGAADALIAMGAGRVAQKIGLETLETKMAKGFDAQVRDELSAIEKAGGALGKRVGMEGTGRTAARLAAGGISEGILQELPQSAQEAVWQNWAEGKPLWQGVDRQAIEGMLVGAAMGAGANIRGAKVKDLIKPAVERPSDQTQIKPAEGQTEMFPEAQPTPGAGINRDRYLQLRKLGADHDTALNASLLTGEHAQELDDAVRQVSPGQAEMFAPRPMATTSGQPLAFGVTTGAGGTHVVRGGKAAKEPKAAKVAVAEVAKINTRADLVNTLDKHLEEARITPEQHDLLMSDATDSKVKLARIRKNLQAAIKETSQQGVPNAIQERGAAQEVPRTGTAGQVVTEGGAGMGQSQQGQEVAAEGKAQIKQGRKIKPVATEPIPEMPVLSEQLPEYEDNMRSYLSSGIDPVNNMIVNRAHGTEEAGGVKSSMEALARDMKMSKQAVHKRYVKTMRELQANAEAAGVSWDRAQELLGIAPAPADTALVGEGATEGGVRTVRAPGEEFEPSYGMTREETLGEQGAVEEGAVAPEAEVSTEETLNQEAEQLATEAPLGVVTAAARIWNLMAQGLDVELTPLQQREYEQRMGSMQDIRNEQDAFAAIERIHDSFMKKHRLGEYSEQVRPEEVRSGREANQTGAQLPEGERVVEEGGYAPVIGEKGAEGVKVSKRKTRKATQATGSWKFPEPAVMRSEGTTQKPSGNTVPTIIANLRKAFFSPVKMASVVSVVQDESNLPDTTDMEEIRSARGGVQGFYDKASGKAWLIANNIPLGQELSVMLHEVGVHMGMRNLLGPENYTKLTNQLKEWYHTGTGREKELIDLAVGRVIAAQKAQQDEAVAEAMADAKEAGVELPEDSITRIRNAAKLNDVTATEEMLAYFVEEAVNAGISPTALSGLPKGLQEWFRTLWAAVKSAVRKLGIDPRTLTARDVVDLAYGAARMELSGTWHGTAGDFRVFSHEYMGTGEGAQAFGWGTYLAQRRGIAEGYRKADVTRKGSGGEDGALMRVDSSVQDDELLDWDKPLSEQSEKVKGALESLEKSLDAAGVLDTYLDAINAEWRELTGKELYGKILAKAHEDDVATISAFDRGDYSNYKEAASKYLDSIGIKGIKFLDQPSRGKDVLRKRISQAEEYLKELRSDEHEHLNPDGSEMSADEVAGATKELEKRLEELKAGLSETRNLVIFNDENLHRVFSQPGGKESARKFSLSDKERGAVTREYGSEHLFENAERAIKKTGAYHTIRVEKQENGKVWATRIPAKTGTEKLRSMAAVKKAAETLAGPAGSKAVIDAAHYLKIAATSLEMLHDTVTRVSKTLPSATEWYKGIMAMKATRTEIKRRADTIAGLASNLGRESYAKTNKFIERATTEQKWYKQPEWLGREVVVDAEMAKEYAKLTPEEKTIADAVFKFGEDESNNMREQFRRLGVSDIFTQLGKLEGPYAPLMRFGGFVGVLKSQALLDAEKAAEDGSASNIAKVEALKRDSKNFVSKKFYTLGQATAFTNSHKSNFAFTDAFAESERLDDKSSMGYQQLQKIMAAIDANTDAMPAGAKESLHKLVKDIYMTTVDQASARQSGQKRQGVAGADENMLNAFAIHARAHAAFVASVEHGPGVNKAFYAMQQEAKSPSGHRTGQDDFNLLARHYAEMTHYDPSPVSDAVMAGTTVWMLSTSLSYHLQNFSQTAVKSVPKLAADFNDYTGAWGHIFDGYKLMGSITEYGKNPDLAKIKDAGLREALTYAADHGMLDVGIEEDLSHLGRAQTGYAMVDGASSLVGKVLHMLRQVSRTVESWNRVSSGAAAYNMAIANGKNHAQAMSYVMEMLNDSQGDTSRTDAPLLLKKMPKVMAQYKRFQFMSAAMYTKATYAAFKGATPEERGVGRRMLGFMMLHTSVAGGVLALPMMNMAALAFSMFGGDDDPEDMDTVIRRNLGEGVVSDFLLDGAPKALLGIDMSAKLSDRNLFSIAPYTTFDFSSKAGVISTVAGVVGGPALSQAGRLADGVGLMQRGEMYKGAEKMVPKGFESAMQAFRLANEGVTLRNGDVIIKPEDLSAYSIALTSVGMPSAQMREITRNQNVQYTVKKFYDDKTKELTQAYVSAARDKDSATMAEIKADWRAMQLSKDKVRYLFNDVPQELKKQPVGHLIRAVMTARKRQRMEQKVAAQ